MRDKLAQSSLNNAATTISLVEGSLAAIGQSEATTERREAALSRLNEYEKALGLESKTSLSPSERVERILNSAEKAVQDSLPSLAATKRAGKKSGIDSLHKEREQIQKTLECIERLLEIANDPRLAQLETVKLNKESKIYEIPAPAALVDQIGGLIGAALSLRPAIRLTDQNGTRHLVQLDYTAHGQIVRFFPEELNPGSPTVATREEATAIAKNPAKVEVLVDGKLSDLTELLFPNMSGFSGKYIDWRGRGLDSGVKDARFVDVTPFTDPSAQQGQLKGHYVQIQHTYLSTIEGSEPRSLQVRGYVTTDKSGTLGVLDRGGDFTSFELIFNDRNTVTAIDTFVPHASFGGPELVNGDRSTTRRGSVDDFMQAFPVGSKITIPVNLDVADSTTKVKSDISGTVVGYSTQGPDGEAAVSMVLQVDLERGMKHTAVVDVGSLLSLTRGGEAITTDDYIAGADNAARFQKGSRGFDFYSQFNAGTSLYPPSK